MTCSAGAGDTRAMLARLSKDPSTPLSEGYIRSRADSSNPDVIFGHLQGLLEREPGIFLERYGARLTSADLATFQPLATESFEVELHLRNLQTCATISAQERQHLSALTKNRRFAMLRRLEDQGVFFSMDSMRERAPEMYEAYIGDIEVERSSPLCQAPDTSLVNALLQRLDGQKLTRLIEGQDKVGQGEEAWSCEEGADADSRGDVDSVRAFERMMRERFLAGNETEWIDYQTVDTDPTLDCYWSRQEALDCQEKYFDAD